jgi:voltage-gated potassium channel
MKTFGTLLGLLSTRQRRENLRLVVWIVVALMVIVLLYSVIFHQLMAAEGRVYSWPTSIYWTIVTMSTLGFGDITFVSDAGRIFSVVVLISGILFLLVLLPFTVIQFVVAPWMDQREAARAPRQVPPGVRGHIIVTRMDPVTQALISRARRSDVPHVVIVEDTAEAARLRDSNYQVMVGDLDAPKTYFRAGVDRAAMVVSTHPDTTNTNVAFTVREVDAKVPVGVTADNEASVDVLQLAGASHVVQLATTLGTAMARRVLGTTGRTHIVGQFGPTRIAEAGARGTSLVGETVASAGFREPNGIRLLAIAESGSTLIPTGETVLTKDSVLILAGSDDDMVGYDRKFSISSRTEESPVLVLGGGRVGRSAARVLRSSGLPYTIVERTPGLLSDAYNVVEGDAADLKNLKKAGLDSASAVLVTTQEDDMNVYLTLYCRRLRPDLQIVSRATYERNVSTLYRAGADGVLSYASIGATVMWNTMGLGQRVVIMEGLELFLVSIPEGFKGLTFSEIEERVGSTGCHVVSIADQRGRLMASTEEAGEDPDLRLLVMGDRRSEQRFRQHISKGAR